MALIGAIIKSFTFCTVSNIVLITLSANPVTASFTLVTNDVNLSVAAVFSSLNLFGISTAKKSTKD